MDAFQARLARIALDAVGDRGFVLGGGHAVQLHGMAARLSEDIDLFSTDRGRPAEVEAEVVAAFRGHQLTVTGHPPYSRSRPDDGQRARRRDLQG